MAIHRWSAAEESYVLFNVSGSDVTISVALRSGRWIKRLDSADNHWGGAGSSLPDAVESSGEHRLTIAGHSVVVYML